MSLSSNNHHLLQPPQSIQRFNNTEHFFLEQNPKSAHTSKPLLASTGSQKKLIPPLLTAYEHIKNHTRQTHQNESTQTGQHVRAADNIFSAIHISTPTGAQFSQSVSPPLYDLTDSVKHAAVQSGFNVNFSQKGQDALHGLRNLSSLNTFTPINTCDPGLNPIHRNAVKMFRHQGQGSSDISGVAGSLAGYLFNNLLKSHQSSQQVNNVIIPEILPEGFSLVA
jgi:hypothetical protein